MAGHWWQRLIDLKLATVRVTKTGLEETLSMFARNHALLHGLICVALALTIGWLGGVIFRRD